MESRLHSSERFSQKPQLRKFSKKFKKTMKDNASDLKVSVIEKSSCPCSTTSIWTRKGTRTLAKSIREKSKFMRQDSLTHTGYAWVQQKKASGIKDTQ